MIIDTETEMKDVPYPVIDMKATGKRIRELRLEKGIKIDDIVTYMGLSLPQAIYKWQRGDSLPSVDNLYALSMLYDTPVEEILVIQKQDY